MPNSVFDDLGFNDPDESSSSGGNPAVWTLLGEAGTDPQGQFRVASTIHNRAEESKSDYDKVVTDPKQGYEAWQDPNARSRVQKDYPVDSPEYKAAQKVLDDLKTGTVKPSSDYYFYSPEAQKKLGRDVPSFDNGTGEDVGGNRFFPKSTSGGSPLDALGFDEPVTGSTTPTVGPDVDITNPNSLNNMRIGNEAQQLSARKSQALGDLTADPKGGSLYKGSPIYMPQSPDDITKIPQGSYYYDPKGVIQYSGPKKGDPGTGALEGAGDVASSIFNVLPGGKDSEIGQRLNAFRAQYDASNRGNPVSDLGRFGGQLTATIPMIAAGGGLATMAGRAAPVIAPVVDALGGTAGTGLTRFGSVAANTGLQGGAQAGLTNSTSDKPLWQQVAEGTAEGAVLGPVAHGIGNVVGNIVRPKASAEISDLVDKAVNQFRINLRTKPTQDAAQHSEWIKAAASTAGADVSKISHNIPPEILAPAIKSAGNTMNNITAKYNLPVTNNLKISLNDAYNSAKSNLDETQMKSIDAIIAGIRSKVVNGEISGPAYQNLMGNKSTLSNAIQGSGPLAHHALEIKDALDDAFQTVLGPEDANIYSKARLQYKNGMTLAKAIGPNGSLEPDALYQSVVNRFKNKAIYGAGPLGTVADIGQVFMKPKPVQNFLSKHIGSVSVGTGAAAMSAAQGLMHNPGAAAGAVTLGATGAGINAFLRNRNYNTGQIVNPLLSYANRQWAVPAAVNATPGR